MSMKNTGGNVTIAINCSVKQSNTTTCLCFNRCFHR